MYTKYYCYRRVWILYESFIKTEIELNGTFCINWLDMCMRHFLGQGEWDRIGWGVTAASQWAEARRRWTTQRASNDAAVMSSVCRQDYLLSHDQWGIIFRKKTRWRCLGFISVLFNLGGLHLNPTGPPRRFFIPTFLLAPVMTYARNSLADSKSEALTPETNELKLQEPSHVWALSRLLRESKHFYAQGLKFVKCAKEKIFLFLFSSSAS